MPGFRARGAGARVAGQGTRVYATGEKTTATSIAGPGRGRAALDGGGRLPAVAGHLHGLGAWGTRTFCNNLIQKF